MRFAFLVLKEHPYGQEMLRILLEHGFIPELVMEEDSVIADEERRKFLERIAGESLPPTIASLVTSRGLSHEFVPNLNGRRARQILAVLQPDLLVLGGTGIIGQAVLAIPRLGTLNSHPGLLPELRGSASVAWAIYKDLPVGSTCHFIDSGIDTGPILIRRALPIHRGETFERIHRRVLTLSGELMAEGLGISASGAARPMPQDLGVGETLRVIPPELMVEVKNKLAEGRYRHYAD
jgi:methionyl-tRNA formyltransferase